MSSSALKHSSVFHRTQVLNSDSVLSQLVSSCALARTNSENSHPKSFTQLTDSGVFYSDILEFLGDIFCVTLPNSQSTEQPSSGYMQCDTAEALLEQLRSSTTQQGSGKISAALLFFTVHVIQVFQEAT